MLICQYSYGQKSPCNILSRAFNALHNSVSGKYEFAFASKNLFSTDTVRSTGTIAFTSKKDSSFKTYSFTIHNKLSILTQDTLVYNIDEINKQYTISSKPQNRAYSHSYNHITGYGSLLDYCRDTSIKVSYMGPHKIGGNRYDKVGIAYVENGISASISLFIDQKSHLIHKMIYQFIYMGDSQYEEITIKNFQLHKKQKDRLDDSIFRTKEEQLSQGYNLIVTNQEKKQSLLDTLTAAPDFKLISDTGDSIQLSKLKGEKLIILDFWYISCYPCLKLSPVLSRLNEKYKRKGLTIIGVDPHDQMDKIRDHKQKHGISYSLLEASKETPAAYHVSAYPTIYILNSDLKIIATFQGYSEKLESELDSFIKRKLE
jgi:peroxiredoxin